MRSQPMTNSLWAALPFFWLDSHISYLILTASEWGNLAVLSHIPWPIASEWCCPTMPLDLKPKSWWVTLDMFCACSTIWPKGCVLHPSFLQDSLMTSDANRKWVTWPFCCQAALTLLTTWPTGCEQLCHFHSVRQYNQISTGQTICEWWCPFFLPVSDMKSQPMTNRLWVILPSLTAGQCHHHISSK